MNGPKYPLIYEINTAVWLTELSQKHHRTITLGNIPTDEWDTLADLGMDAVWLMGVWERSPGGRAIAMKNHELQEEFRRALPDCRPEDIIGSPYCVRRYTVEASFGGTQGLATARHNLAARSVALILDLVPNHVAPDHPWVVEHPEYFIRGDMDDLQRDPASFFEAAGKVFARGRDPFFPAWPDVLQLNAFNDGLREAAIETLNDIADQSDGVRCDMGMLLLNEVFERTWGSRAGERPASEYWSTVIPAVKRKFPDFTFIAEAYWDMEWQLQQLGFDFCYDKRLYDRVLHESPESVRSHLLADATYQDGLVRFIENHDEPRAASVFSQPKQEAAATLVATLPGARLIHEGQMDGRKVRLPVFLSRRPHERLEPSLRYFYRRLLKMVNRDVFRNGGWQLCERTGWPDNSSFQNLGAWCWTGAKERYLIVVNLSEVPSQALIQVPWTDLTGKSCWLADALSVETYERRGTEMVSPGLFVDLKPWARHCFQVQSTKPRQRHGGDRLTRQRPGARTIQEDTDLVVAEHVGAVGG
jgi:glycosidase